ncbi:MAG: ThuA domain-containing protein [Candidatus Goldbacteria bacterium]|nr:ThuA domain-containing protein [Candidatus Goldiibacteriota bacterium]
MRRILIIYGGFKFHEPYKTVSFFLPFLRENGFNIDIYSDINIYSDYRRLKEYDIIFQNYGEKKITEKQEQGLTNAIKSGVGLIGFHAGLCDTFKNSYKYQHMVGGQFVFHPKVKKFKVIINRRSKLLNGIKDFYIKTELYYFHFSPEIKIHAWTVIENKIKMPVVWSKKYGKGKIFYCSLGHDTQDFEKKEFFEIMKRGILWVSKK